MVLWCKDCGALLGLRPPLTNWSTDRNGLCAACLAKQIDLERLDPNNSTSENAALPPDAGTSSTTSDPRA